VSIDLFVPSRGRPSAAAELAASFTATKALETTRLVFLVDSDDPTAQDYPTGGCTVIFDAPTGDPTGPLNRAALTSEASIVGFMGDDSRCMTPGWDVMVERALAEPGLAWGCDETGPVAWPSTAFATADIVRALGYFALPSLRRGFFDVQWITTARAAGVERVIRASFPHDNHEHPVAPEVIAADQMAFEAWRTGGGAARDAKIVRLARDLAHFFPPDLIYA
jgi:hypothetical protein